ncbi:MAG TPA: hypothetical protein VHR65_00790 [Solirubrobacterales bacterium]|nr:hypothetical protein [Solirubrobacterales bacterium]
MNGSLGGARLAKSARHSGQRRPDVPSFVAHLPVSEAERGEAGGKMSLVANSVTDLLSRRAVIAKPVGLDHEPQVRPVEVDPESIHVLPSQGHGQSSIGNERQEATLQLRVGQTKGAAAEELPHAGYARPAREVVERKSQRFRIDEVNSICLVDRSLQSGIAERPGEIDERQDRNDKGNAVVDIDVLRAKMRSPVDANSGPVAW